MAGHDDLIGGKAPQDAALGSYRTTWHEYYSYGSKLLFLIIPPEAGVAPIGGDSPESPPA